MAQLTDDCFAFSGPLLPIADMERMITERVQPVTASESVPLGAARGRVLAADVTAPIDLPPFDNSAVDGYAVRHSDLTAQAETRLAVSGRLTAGSATARPIDAGQAIRIFTGAPVPAGADAVVIQENTERPGEDRVWIIETATAGVNIRPAGNDFGEGDVLLRGGARLSPAACALAASGGYDLPAFEKLTTLKTWAEESPPKGTLYHYPNPHDHQKLSISAAGASWKNGSL